MLALGVVASAQLGCSSDPIGSSSGDADGGADATRVLPPSATNQKKDNDETDVDCGGKVALACKTGGACLIESDCASNVCVGGVCAAPSATDKVRNGSETDIDCGGGAAPGCIAGKRCGAAPDCASSVCTGKICQAATTKDGVKNGTESGVDCGGSDSSVARCAVAGGCTTGADCTSLVCTQSACKAPTTSDGIKNGDETGKDCGGATPGNPRCPVAEGCVADPDCGGKNCDSGTKLCVAPSPSNNKQDGDETAVDCGGAIAPKCSVGKTCLVARDCASDGCGYKGTCVTARSCVGRYGGDTCGTGEIGAANAQNDDCCKSAPVTVGANTVQLDIYKVTAGRMRAFINAVGGNVRKFVQDARIAGKIPAGVELKPSWDLYLPVSLDGNMDAGELADPPYGNGPQAPMPGIYTSVNRQLSGFLFSGQSLPQQGCRIDSPGTHTYWMNAATQASSSGDIPFAYNTSDPYDSKALNCVNYLMAQSFCVWDGGRLETFPEWLAAWGPDVMPWGAGPSPFGPGSATFNGFRYPTATDASLRANNMGAPQFVPLAGSSIEYGTYLYSYEFPTLVGGDYMSFINAPGRLRGRGPAGHADIVGTMMEVTGTHTTTQSTPQASTATWTSNGSFEGHGWRKSVIWSGFSMMNKYGKQGLRCARP